MRFVTTDGKDYVMPDQCGYCNITTGGEHQSHCPLFHMAEGYKQMAEVNSQLAEEGLSQFNEVWRSKMDKENSRLLTEEEYQKLPKHASMTGVIGGESSEPGSSDWKVYAGDIAKAQDAKTVGIKEAEFKARVERIFREIERYASPYCALEEDIINISLDGVWWRAFKEEIK